MRVFVDSNVVIYLIEQPPVWGPRAARRFRALHEQGDRVFLSDLVRMECRVGPLRDGDTTTVAEYDAFFGAEVSKWWG